MKKILTLILTLYLLLCLSPAAIAVVDQSESFYVADYANVLSDATEQTVIERNALLEQYCHEAQIVVVTVDYLDGMYSDEYAYQLFNDWGVGSAEESNGMLLLLAVQENKAWLAYGYGLSSAMGDRVDGLLDSYFWHDFDRGDYDAAVTKLLEGLTDFYEELYGVSLSGNARTWQSGTTLRTGSDHPAGHRLCPAVRRLPKQRPGRKRTRLLASLAAALRLPAQSGPVRRVSRPLRRRLRRSRRFWRRSWRRRLRRRNGPRRRWLLRRRRRQTLTIESQKLRRRLCSFCSSQPEEKRIALCPTA